MNQVPGYHSCRLILIATILASGASAAIAAVDRDPAADRAVAAGLAFLAKQQSDDGNFPAQPSMTGPEFATTSRALLAFLSAGHVQDVGRYGLIVRRAVDLLVRSAPADGNFGAIDRTGTAGQAIVTLALSEAFAVEPDPRQRARIGAIVERAGKVIVDAQNQSGPTPGGWKAAPAASGDDLVVSTWSLLALGAARNIGANVPQDVFDRGVAYVRSCEVGRGFNNGDGTQASAPLTAAGLLSLTLFDPVPDKPAGVEIESLRRLLADTGLSYGSLFFAQTTLTQLAQIPSNDPAASNQTEVIAERLEQAQSPDRGWPAADDLTRVDATSLAILSLTCDAQFLPSLQRPIATRLAPATAP